MYDLSERITNRVQLTTDSMRLYASAVEKAFGNKVDYAQIVKSYGSDNSKGRYSPAQLISVEKSKIQGSPDQELISTSYVERQNLTMRMHMRRLTRLTNAFSKKLDSFKAAVALHFGYYNFVRVHKTLKATPAFAAGITRNTWTVADLIERAS